MYPPRSKSVGLCFVCTQRKVGLLCYLRCCLSKAHTSASLFPRRASKGLLFFHRGAFLNSEFRHVGHGWIDPYEKKALHLQGSPLAEIFFSFFFFLISLYEAMWLYLPQNIILFWLCPFNNNLALGVDFVRVLVLHATSSFPNSAIINRFT